MKLQTIDNFWWRWQATYFNWW